MRSFYAVLFGTICALGFAASALADEIGPPIHRPLVQLADISDYLHRPLVALTDDNGNIKRPL